MAPKGERIPSVSGGQPANQTERLERLGFSARPPDGGEDQGDGEDRTFLRLPTSGGGDQPEVGLGKALRGGIGGEGSATQAAKSLFGFVRDRDPADGQAPALADGQAPAGAGGDRKESEEASRRSFLNPTENEPTAEEKTQPSAFFKAPTALSSVNAEKPKSAFFTNLAASTKKSDATTRPSFLNPLGAN